jgi:hypothetical protein
VQIIDPTLCTIMWSISQLYSDQGLESLARNDVEDGGRGRANTILTLSLDSIKAAYLAFPSEMRYRKIVVEDHTLDESVLAILEDIDVPEYERVS